MTLTAAEVIRIVSGLTARDRQLAAAIRGEPAVTQPSALERALTDAAGVLARAGMSYALIGGVAVAIHAAQPRATQAVDLAVRSDAGRERLISAFTSAGFELRGEFPHSLNFLHAGGDPVRLALDPTFDAAIERAESFALAGASLRIVRREDLIALKERAAADPSRRRSKALRDRADLELLRGDVPDPHEGW